MKKQITFLILVLAMVVVVAGCEKKQLQPEDNQIVDNQSQINSNQGQEAIDSSVDISNWHDYQYLNLKLKYPIKWEIDINNKNFVSFRDVQEKVYYEGEEAYLIGIQRQDFEDDNQLKKYIENWKEIKLKRGGVVKNFLLNNKEVIQGVDYLGKVTLIINNNSIYSVTKGRFSPDYPQIDDFYDAILKSLEFID